MHKKLTFDLVKWGLGFSVKENIEMKFLQLLRTETDVLVQVRTKKLAMQYFYNVCHKRYRKYLKCNQEFSR